MLKTSEWSIAGNCLRFPESGITTDIDGFLLLTAFHQHLSNLDYPEIVIDLMAVPVIDQCMIAALNAVLLHKEATGASVRIVGDNAFGKAIFEDGRAKPEMDQPSDRRAKHFDLDEAVALSKYAAAFLPPIRDSGAAGRRFVECVDEAFSNAALHSRSPIGAFVSGKPISSNGQVSLAIVDGGRGIPGSYQQAQLKYAPDEDAIAWAMVANHSTKEPGTPGGLGSVVLRRFVEDNNGTLTIVSRNGFWCQTGRYESKNSLPHAFPGTVVVLDISALATSWHDSDKRIDPNDIW